MKTITSFFYVVAALFFTANGKLMAQAGLPDPAFGTNGLVTTDVGTTDEGYSVIVQPDGKILVGGYVTLGSEDFSVTRYNTNGSLDMTFGTGGTATADFGNNDRANEVLLQPDGKIILAGYAYNSSGMADFAVARFLSNGTPDNTFGVQGKAQTDFASDHDFGYAACLQADGKIVVGGPVNLNSGGDAGFVRYNTDGSLDTTFNGTGKVTVDITGGYDGIRDMAVQPDGKIVATGNGSTTPNYDFVLVRLLPSGAPDNSFGTNGKVITPVGPAEDVALGIAIQTNGKIVVAGYVWNAGMTDTDYGLVRYNTDGSLDNTFGTGGKAIGPIGTSYDWLRGVTLQSDGKIVATGQISQPSGYTDIALLRFDTTGALDNTFNGNGIVIRDVAGSMDCAFTVCMQPDGKILLTGNAIVNNEVDIVTLRYLGGPNPQGIALSPWNCDLRIYPNPVAEQVVMDYTLMNPEKITVKLYDQQGRLVRVLVSDEMQPAGKQSRMLSLPEHLSTGTYSIVLTSAAGNVVQKILKE